MNCTQQWVVKTRALGHTQGHISEWTLVPLWTLDSPLQICMHSPKLSTVSPFFNLSDREGPYYCAPESRSMKRGAN